MMGGRAEYRALDVTTLEDVQAFVKFGLETYGRIDVIVNNAGVMPLSRLEELKVDEWNRMIDVNIRGVLHGIAATLSIKEAACRVKRQLPLFGETPKRSKAKATTKYLRNYLPRILSTTHRNRAVSAQIAMERGTSTKSYAQPSPIFTPKSIGKFRTAIA